MMAIGNLCSVVQFDMVRLNSELQKSGAGFDRSRRLAGDLRNPG
jgi:hypothetical protein